MIDMTYTDPLRYNREVPLRRANKNRATQKHEAPLKIASPEKMIGRSHINDVESSVPAMGDPNSFKLPRGNSEGNNRFIPTRPPRPVKLFSLRRKLALSDNIPVKAKQTPNRAPISESLVAVDPTIGTSRLASSVTQLIIYQTSGTKGASYMTQRKIHREWQIL